MWHRNGVPPPPTDLYYGRLHVQSILYGGKQKQADAAWLLIKLLNEKILTLRKDSHVADSPVLGVPAVEGGRLPAFDRLILNSSLP